VLFVFALSLSAQPLPNPARADAPTADPTPLPGVHFVHVATAGNIRNSWTYLDHPLLNGDNGAVVLVTQNYNPKGMDGTPNDEPIGVWYDTGENKWAIFNQDMTPMPPDAAFNVHIPVQDFTLFVHEATDGNSVANYTLLDHFMLNGTPGAMVFVTQNWNPSGEPGRYNPHVVGVEYREADQQWCILNLDGAPMTPEASFNVLVSSPDETAVVHIATTGNTSGYFTGLDDVRINGNPNALLTATQNKTPQGVENPHAIGVQYVGEHWYVFNQDSVNIPQNAAFNVLIPPTASAAFVHVASLANSQQYFTWLDHPLLNGNPDAIVLATQHGGPWGTPNDHNIGVWYDSWEDKWTILNQDEASMPADAAFNVYIPPIGANVFTHVVTPANRDGHETTISHPESNGEPFAVGLFTPNKNPAGLPGTYNDRATGILYHDAQQKATIYNEDMASELPLDAAFNVLIPGDEAIVFVHTTTIENTFGGGPFTYLDHPALNGNPNALVYVTHNRNPGGGSTGADIDQPLAVWYDGRAVYERWVISAQDFEHNDMPLDADFNVLVIANYATYLPLVLRSPSP
jgi:hypothetical protein